jgi:anti-anti-sigma factor
MNRPSRVSSPAVSVSTERIGTIAIVHLFGDLDLATTDHAEQEIVRAACGGTALVIDLDGLSFLGSTGLSLLVRWQSKAEEHGFGFRVVAARRQVLRPIQLTGLDKLFTVDATVDQSLRALPRRASQDQLQANR